VVITTMLSAAAACGSSAPGDTDDTADSSIEIVVALPDDWPNPMYTGRADVVVERVDGVEFRTPARDRRVTVQLPAHGDFTVGAVVEDGGCFDTAGVAQGGNPSVPLDDGDVVTLQDTGEICD
jgi:hypothetical protein